MTQKNTFQRATLVAAGLALTALGAQAQHLIQTNGTIVAYTGDVAPSGGGATFNASNFDISSMDDLGRVFFRAQLIGTGVTPNNQRAYYTGTDRSNLTQVIRSADPVPTLGGGEILALSATAIGIGSNTRYAANGGMFWPGNIFGGASTTANDTALFTGTPGSFIIASREGDAAPGTVGATMSSSLSGLGAQGTALNAAGRIIFQSATLGGDTTTANNAAWFTGVPGNLEKLIRKGDAIPTGEAIGSLGFSVLMNASGVVLHDESLSLTLGSPVATAANNATMLVYTPGVVPGTGTNAVLMREGDAALGTVGAVMGNALNSLSFNFSPQGFNNGGKAFVQTQLTPGVGDTTVNVNDYITYLGATSGSLVPVVRRGDAAPGLTGGELMGVNNGAQMALNNSDHIAFQNSMSGGTVTTANDSSIWFGTVGNLQLVVREGDAAPGTTGALIGNLAGLANFWLNDANQLTFQAALTGGDVVLGTNEQMLYSWTAATGLTPIIRKGDQIEVNPSVFNTVLTWGGLQFGNGDGRTLAFNNSGKMHLDVSFTSPSGKAVMTVVAPNQVGTAFCSGDGTGTTCPCGNAGLANRGCANFNFSQGAQLIGTGTAGASVLTDTLVLTASEIPGPGLFFQGSSTFGPGLAFGDGLLCAGGTLVRMGVVFPTGNSASYPGGLTPAQIHVAGGTSPGDIRHYQCWYRDSGESSPGISFCTTDTYNLTQGLTIQWGL